MFHIVEEEASLLVTVTPYTPTDIRIRDIFELITEHIPLLQQDEAEAVFAVAVVPVLVRVLAPVAEEQVAVRKILILT